MRLFRLLSALLVQGFLLTSLSLISCNSTPTNQELIEEYITKCSADPYKKPAEDYYKNDPDFGPRFESIEVYSGPGPTEESQVNYIRALTKKSPPAACAYLVKLNLAGQLCAEEAYVDEEKNFSRDISTRKCM